VAGAVVVEHTFITTLEAREAMRRASEMLATQGFAADTAFAVQKDDWNTLEMRRGKKRASRAKNIAELPQVVHIHYDRGRVNLALSIEPNYVWGGGSFSSIGFGIDSTSPTGNSKKMRLHAELLTAIAEALEQVMSHEPRHGLSLQRWDFVEEEIRRVARRRTIRNIILVVAIPLIIAALITLVIVLS
jgi:hypothetical protein